MDLWTCGVWTRWPFDFHKYGGLWTQGPKEMWICGAVYVWALRCADMICGYLDMWPCGYMDVWTTYAVELWTYESVDMWIFGSVDVWACGLEEIWMFGPV